MQRRTARIAAGGLSLLGGLAIWVIATELFPHHSLNHDEGVYLQQAQLLLEGQLRLYPPLEGAFRPWFFVEAGDSLYPKYAPVPSAAFAVGLALGVPRLVLALIGAVLIALTYATASELTDRRTGVVAAGLFGLAPLFLFTGSVFLPYAFTTAFNLCFAWAYFRSVRTGDRRWAATAGGAIGLAFFARPYTAVLFAAPFLLHAVWTVSRSPVQAGIRQALTATSGLLGVGLTLGYNWTLTGAPLRFPYQVFGPLDGPGFGHRELLGHSVEYTLGLAIRSTMTVLETFVTHWSPAGLLGIGAAVVGLAVVLRRGPHARIMVLAGIVPSVILGNVGFWGNYNILGDPAIAGDGLIAFLGPYYHFDLLAPIAIFGAIGMTEVADSIRREFHTRLAREHAQVAVGVILVASATVVGAVTVTAAGPSFERNKAVTATYEDAYTPFENGAPADAVVLLPDPYGPWLNHPFQALRNDPGYNGRTVYALDGWAFEVIDAYPDRQYYRYGYRGVWSPPSGSPDAARIQRVHSVVGEQIRLDSALGIPSGAIGVTIRVESGDSVRYFTVDEPESTLNTTLLVTDHSVSLSGEVEPVNSSTMRIAGPEEVILEAFVDYGASGGFSYLIEIPIRQHSEEEIQALTPVIERCRRVAACGGAATHIPATAPAGTSVETTLGTAEHNS